MIKHYLTICLRNLKRYKIQSIISIFGLSIGFLSFTLCNYYVQYYSLFNTQFPNAGRIYKLNTDLTENDLYQEFPEIEKILRLSSPVELDIGAVINYKINTDEKDITGKGLVTVNALDPSFIDFFSLTVAHGTKEMIARTDNGIVAFETFAKTLTNDVGSLVGKELIISDLNGREDRSYYITGILKDPPANSTFGQGSLKNRYITVSHNPKKNLTFNTPGNKFSSAYYIQLHKTVSKRKFISKLDHYFSKDTGGNETEVQYVLKPFTGLENFPERTINIFKFLYIFGLLILFASLFNFVLLQFSMYYNNFREYGIRIANGVNVWQFMLQLFVDIGVRFLLSVVIVFCVINVCFHTFEKIYNDLIHIHLSLSLLRSYMMKYMLYGMALSFTVSYILSRNLLKLSVRSVSGYLIRKKNMNMGRNMLLFLQLSVILFFISAAGIVKLQVGSMKSDIFSNLTQNERENIISFTCGYPELREQHDVLSQKMMRSASVLDVAYSNIPVISWNVFRGKIEGIENQEVIDIRCNSGFLDFFHGHILQGTTFNSDIDYDAVIVNKNFQKLYPNESLIGKTFDYKAFPYQFSNSETCRIIGIVDNIQVFETDISNGIAEIDNLMENDVLFFRLQPASSSSGVFYVKCNTGQINEAKQHIEASLKEFLPESSQIAFKTLQEVIGESFLTEKLISYSSVIFFIISFLLGFLSIYSSILTILEKRRKEIAIRKINGAGLKDVALLFSKTYFKLWSLACCISFPFIYYYASKWLERYKDPIAINLLLLLFVIIFVVILALITVIINSQIIKAAKANPAEVVKSA